MSIDISICFISSNSKNSVISIFLFLPLLLGNSATHYSKSATLEFSHSFPLLCCVKFSVSVLMVILDVLCIVSFLSLVLEIGRHLSYKLY